LGIIVGGAIELGAISNLPTLTPKGLRDAFWRLNNFGQAIAMLIFQSFS